MPYKNKEDELRWQREYSKKNREKINLLMKKWRERNQEKVKEANRKNWIKHKEEYSRMQKEWVNKNRPLVNKYNLEYYHKHNEKYKKEHREYYYNNLEKQRIRSKNYNQKNKLKEKLHKREYYKKNKEKISQRTKKYRDRHKIKLKVYHKNYYEKNKKKLQDNRKKRQKIDKEFLISCRLHALLGNVFRNFIKTGKVYSSKKYGINYKEIIEHLKPFPEDLSKYHIDHIRPICSFKFVNPDDSTNLEEVKKAFAPENHQWLTAEENMSKASRDKKEKMNFYSK